MVINKARPSRLTEFFILQRGERNSFLKQAGKIAVIVEAHRFGDAL